MLSVAKHSRSVNPFYELDLAVRRPIRIIPITECPRRGNGCCSTSENNLPPGYRFAYRRLPFYELRRGHRLRPSFWGHGAVGSDVGYFLLDADQSPFGRTKPDPAWRDVAVARSAL